jgi:hypothetical protein
MPESVVTPKRKPTTLREDLLTGVKLLKSEKDGRPQEKIIDEALEQYLGRRKYFPLPKR